MTRSAAKRANENARTLVAWAAKVPAILALRRPRVPQKCSGCGHNASSWPYGYAYPTQCECCNADVEGHAALTHRFVFGEGDLRKVHAASALGLEDVNWPYAAELLNRVAKRVTAGGAA